MREHKVNDIQPESTSHAGMRPVVAGLIGTMLLLMVAMVTAPAPSFARMSVGIFVNFGPPALPVYVQPPCPGPDYMWTPGYWAWDPDSGYYWVPGTWVAAPFVGALWTPDTIGCRARGWLRPLSARFGLRAIGAFTMAVIAGIPATGGSRSGSM